MEQEKNTILVLPDNVEIMFQKGKTIKEILDAEGIFLTYPCGGKGECGKCLVHLIDGEIPEATQIEKDLIPEEKLLRGYRLACQCKPMGEVCVVIPPASREESAAILMEFRADRKIRFSPVVRKKHLSSLVPANIENQVCDTKLVGKSIKARSWALNAMHSLPHVLRRGHYKITATLYNHRVIEIEPGDTSQRIYGVAVDIGTTTIASALVDLKHDMILARRSIMNPQGRLGADVISRLTTIVDEVRQNGDIEAAERVVHKFQRLVLEPFQEIIESMCEENNIDPTEVFDICVAGNTVMSHFFLGVNPQYVGLAPFVSVFHEAQLVLARDLHLKIHPEGMVYTLPNIGGFVGGDIVADILVAGLDRKSGPVMLVDVGTNGEVVVKSKSGSLFATSAAAGPAFEGAQISHGMQAVPGAIDRIMVSPEKGWRISTIAGEQAIGICGSGIVSVIAELYKIGIISPQGRVLSPAEISPDSQASLFAHRSVEKEGQRYVLIAGEEEHAREPIFISQKDIRELQLAKGAIATAQETLLRIADVKPEEIETLFIAGAFGSYISPHDAKQIGLVVPGIPLERIQFIGDAALAGATLVLRSKRCRKLVEDTAPSIQFVELANRPDFQETFIFNTTFPEVN